MEQAAIVPTAGVPALQNDRLPAIEPAPAGITALPALGKCLVPQVTDDGTARETKMAGDGLQPIRCKTQTCWNFASRRSRRSSALARLGASRCDGLVLQPVLIGLGAPFPVTAASALLMAPSPE